MVCAFPSKSSLEVAFDDRRRALLVYVYVEPHSRLGLVERSGPTDLEVAYEHLGPVVVPKELLQVGDHVHLSVLHVTNVVVVGDVLDYPRRAFLSPESNGANGTHRLVL